MLSGLDLVSVGQLREDDERADPLAHWKASSASQDYLIRSFLSGLWVYGHAGNRSGKTEGIAAPAISMLQGRATLTGYREPISIPMLRPPVIGVLCGESYKAMGLSSVFTLRRLLGAKDGNWTEEHAGSPDSVSLFRIRHRDARSEADWSRLYVFPYDGALPEGGGLDFWWCDEPPPARYISILGARVASGRLLRQAITATPQEKAKWFHISQQFPKERCKPVNGRVRIQWSAAENEALGPRERKQLVDNAAGKPFERSILYGDEVDIAGGCPWPGDLLQAALSKCVEPKRVDRIAIEKSAGGEAAYAALQVWEDAEAGEPCYLVCDPAKGIRSGDHDPDGLHVRSRKTKRLKARLSGYLGGWALGCAADVIGRRYNLAVVDVLTTGGYGEAVLQALRKRRYPALAHSRVEVRPGDWEDRIGTIETHEMRGKMVGAVEREILAGEFDCPSAEIVQCLMDCTVDEHGKVLASLGSHDEDLICWGRGSVYLGQWDAPKTREKLPKYENPVHAILKRIEKRDEALGLANGPKVIQRYRGNGRSVARVVTIDP